jgi:hypothetical protein
MNWDTFKNWYMARYWEFDNLFLVGAKLFGITYHEFVLITLVIIWPLLTLVLSIAFSINRGG